jgi:hypothetical protein
VAVTEATITIGPTPNDNGTSVGACCSKLNCVWTGNTIASEQRLS